MDTSESLVQQSRTTAGAIDEHSMAASNFLNGLAQAAARENEVSPESLRAVQYEQVQVAPELSMLETVVKDEHRVRHFRCDLNAGLKAVSRDT
jgi:hypothetical protein